MNTNMTGFRVFRNLCFCVLWMKVALSLEGSLYYMTDALLMIYGTNKYRFYIYFTGINTVLKLSASLHLEGTYFCE